MATTAVPRRYYDQVCFRVWPDGTVQEADEPVYSHMSDDYVLAWAYDEDTANASVRKWEAANGQDK